jgi:predicted amino acid-binding ACT domain protein
MVMVCDEESISQCLGIHIGEIVYSQIRKQFTFELLVQVPHTVRGSTALKRGNDQSANVMGVRCHLSGQFFGRIMDIVSQPM